MKTANKILLTAFVLLILALFSILLILRMELSRELHQGSGNVIIEERAADSFNMIEVRGNFNVYLTQSDNYEIRVEADDNLMDYILTDIKKDQLKIRLNKAVGKHSKMNVYIAFSDLNRLDGSVGAHFIADQPIKGENFIHNLHSGAESTLNLHLQQLEVNLKGGVSTRLSGHVADMFAKVTSGSRMDSKELHVVNCDVKGTSGAEISVFVTESLTAKATSGSVIYHYGDPKHTEWNTSFGGSIIAK